MMPTAKAYIRAIDHPRTMVEFQFNPAKYSVSKSVQWTPSRRKGADTPPAEFVQGDGRSITMELFVDSYEPSSPSAGGSALAKKQPVASFVKDLESFTKVYTENAKDEGKPRPPRVEFHWASGPVIFPAYVKSLNVTYTLFHPDGRPARATINLALQELPNEPSSQPGSSGGRGTRSHTVLPGETLDTIAYAELGDAKHWKAIAELNRLDDPFGIRPGQELIVTPLR